MADDMNSDLSTLTADIVAAYVSNNKVGAEDLAQLIGSTYQALRAAGEPPATTAETPKPDKASVKKSVHPDYLTSFIDGRRYKSLKRHLNSQGLSPGEYRDRFGLASDYPMVAPNYSAQRSALAKSLGLGRKAAGGQGEADVEAEAEPQAAAAEPAAAPAKGRGRKPKAAAAEG